MANFNDHGKVIEMINVSQMAEEDIRKKVREQLLFLDGNQWEQRWWDANDGNPRYTFDLTSPIIDQISGEMEQADFDIKVKPSGGDASKDTAKLLDGLIRNIENISNATHIFNQAGRSMVGGGLDGWAIEQRFVDADSFEQDLVIVPVGNFIDRVWFDVGSELQDRSDAKWGVKLSAFTPEEYKDKFPDGSGQPLSQDREFNFYFNQPEMIMVGEFYYIKEVERELVLMSNGKVYEDNDDFKKVVDELKGLGVTEDNRRKRKGSKVFVRKLDNGGWLDTEKETVFSWVPLIPTYGNFKISENKLIFFGATKGLIDWQRVFNYAKSREIGEGALAPRAKYWGTEAQRAGHEDEIDTLNTNNDAWQDYNHVLNVPPPFVQGGAQINQGLIATSQSMQQGIAQSAGLFAANMGDNPNAQSGVAIEQLQNKGDTSTIKYFSAQEMAICHTARILIDAIPRSYPGEQQVRILNEDGSFDMTVLNQEITDEQTGEDIVLNDLSVGTYDVTCSAGPSFQNRQQETVAAIVEMAAVDPSIIGVGSDVLLSNVTAPGMDLIAARKRMQLLQQGLIPEEQMTDEEKEAIAAQQAAQQAAQAEQGQQPDAGMLIAQAELQKAETADTKMRVDAEVQATELDLKQKEQDRRDADTRAKIVDGDDKADREDMRLLLEQNQAILAGMKTQAETLKLLREAQGVDTFTGPHTTEAFISQAAEITDTQKEAGFDTSIGEDVTGR